MAGSRIGYLLKRYSIVVIFPTFTVSSIYADWSHTREWKKQLEIINRYQVNKDISDIHWYPEVGNSINRTMAIAAKAIACALPFVGFAIGHYLDVQETERMTLFRDKSALYGRKDDDENSDRPPSW